MMKHPIDPAGPEAHEAIIGLALGSGAARGWAHIGVLQALHDLGIRPRVITGTSVGALVAAVYASGKLEDFAEWVVKLRWDALLRYGDLGLRGGGLFSGKKLLRALSPFLSTTAIEYLPITFAAVATDLDTGREIWMRSGSLSDAVRASISIPGLFSPTRAGSGWLVDGGLVNPVPISLCRALGAHRVIAVNLNGDQLGRRLSLLSHEPEPGEEIARKAMIQRTLRFLPGMTGAAEKMADGMLGASHQSPGMVHTMINSLNIMQDRITRSRIAGDPPEVLLVPRLGKIGLLEFDRAEDAMLEGLAVVQRMRPALEDALSNGR